MEKIGVDNDTRGWIMCVVSGVACVVGASIICVDLLVRLIPSKRHFSIQDSNGFLACSLSLSFGVMLFSALYSMLPSSKRYLAKGGFDGQTASFIMMGCFVGGFFGIQIVSRLLHQFMPSHVVDCDHTHDDLSEDGHSESHHRHMSRASRSRRHFSRRRSSTLPAVKIATMAEVHDNATESTPLLPTMLDQSGHADHHGPPHGDQSAGSDVFSALTHGHALSGRGRSLANGETRRPSMLQVPSRVMSFMKDTKTNCDEYGPCFGYSDPCGQECFKHLGSRSALTSRFPTMVRTTSDTLYPRPATFARVPGDEDGESLTSPVSPTNQTKPVRSREGSTGELDSHDHHHEGTDECCSQMSEDLEAQHHHHVPANGFLSIGLQLVIAIALHKFPEGFITYATNHANPALGFNVFMALFVHNIAEGFAMALPLYMALGSRLKAVTWSAMLGGLSQPLGAAIAMLWFKLARRTHVAIDNVAYACLFAATAGIMTNVALQLFVESLSLYHSRNLSIFFAFLGMTLLGVSNALVTE